MLHVHLPFFGKFKRHQNHCMLHWFFQWGLSLISKGAIWHHRHGISNPFALYSTPSQVSSTPGLPRTRLTKSPVERFGFKRYHHYILYHMFYMIDHVLYNIFFYIVYILFIYYDIHLCFWDWCQLYKWYPGTLHVTFFVLGLMPIGSTVSNYTTYIWPSLFWDWCQMYQWYPIIYHHDFFLYLDVVNMNTLVISLL